MKTIIYSFLLTLLALNSNAQIVIQGQINVCANVNEDIYSSSLVYEYKIVDLIGIETITNVVWEIRYGTLIYQNTGDEALGLPTIKALWKNPKTVLCAFITAKSFTTTNSITNVVINHNNSDLITEDDPMPISPNIAKQNFTLLPLTSWAVNIEKGNTAPITYTMNYTLDEYTLNSSQVEDQLFYTWTLPLGWTSSGALNGTDLSSITVTPSADNLTGATISVTVKNIKFGCNNLSRTYTRTITRPLGALPSITGTTSICSWKSIKYSLPNNPFITNYTWTIPSGWTINGQGTNIVYITPPSTYFTSYGGSGTISVVGSTSEYSTPLESLSISVGKANFYDNGYLSIPVNHYIFVVTPYSTFEKSVDNITWSPSVKTYNILYPEEKNYYFKATNVCGSRIKYYNMHSFSGGGGHPQ